MAVDSYRWLPRALAELYRGWDAERRDPVPFTALPGGLAGVKLALLTSAGIFVEGAQPPFDAERERREPTWGDPSWRAIPRDAPRQGIGAGHLHIDNGFVREDLNVALPLDHAEAALAAGRIGAIADVHPSVMGYQLDTGEWERGTGPEIADALLDEGVGAALLTPI